MVLWYIPSALSADALIMLHWKDQLKRCRSGVAWGCWPNILAPSRAVVGYLHLTTLLSGRTSQRLWELVLGKQYENQYKNLMDHGY